MTCRASCWARARTRRSEPLGAGARQADARAVQEAEDAAAARALVEVLHPLSLTLASTRLPGAQYRAGAG
ncbi:hypothetical protein, partial [Azospirillum sp. B4]|uniref:hypothetical protein n=1 Tax=Azospirillum sp. B4 TaxID=95605 RepID=UPI001B3BD9C4